MRKLLLIASLFVFAFAFAGCKKQEEAKPVQPAKAVAVEPTKQRFIVGLDDSFPPMGFRDENNAIVGFDIDLATEVAKRLGYELVLQPIDWASKELELNNNNIDCIWNGLSVDPVRQEQMLLSKPYLANNMIIIVKADSPIKAKADLKDKRVGVQDGSTAVKSLEKDAISKSVKKQNYENNVLALSDLKIGRVDAVVMDEVVARYQTSKDTSSFRILNDNLESEVYAIAFKKGNTELADKVAAAIDAMMKDGTADKISVKWFGAPVMLK